MTKFMLIIGAISQIVFLIFMFKVLKQKFRITDKDEFVAKYIFLPLFLFLLVLFMADLVLF
jgi:hypothetical protein